MAIWWSAIGLVASLLVALLSFVPAVPPLPIGLTLACSVGIFPVFGAAFLAVGRGWTRHREDRRERAADLLGNLPPWVVLVPVVAFGSLFVAPDGPPGTPEIHHGQYYFSVHGGLIPTTLTGYQQGQREEQREFGADAAAFYALAFAFHRLRRDQIRRRRPTGEP